MGTVWLCLTCVSLQLLKALEERRRGGMRVATQTASVEELACN